MNVQFSDETNAVIVAYFASPQDPDVFLNMGTVEASDVLWHTYYDQLPAYMQRAFPAPE